MNKKKKRRSFFAIILTICMCTALLSVSIPVFAETSGDYTYSINSDELTCTITKYNGAGGYVAIPSTLDTYKVTAIGDQAFKGDLNINNITIPNSVTNIGAFAFRECKNLNSITIPDSVTTIQDYAFLNAENLNNVTLPSSVTFIGFQGFSNCYNLTNITIPNSVTTMEGSVFSGCTNLVSITLPNSITSIEGDTFSHCDNLKNVTIPNSVTSIKGWAFYHCDALESITIPQSVKSVGMAAFYDCASFKSITIPQSVVSIGNAAFRLCPQLTSVYFNGKPSTIGTQVFDGSPCTLYSPTEESLSSIPCTAAATYSITVNSVSNGTIFPSTLSGMKNQTISLQMVPDEGYTSDPTLLKYNDGVDVAISGISFIMPDKNITLSGGFEQIPIPIVTTPSVATDNQKPTWSWTNVTGVGYYRYKLNDGSWAYTPFTSFTPTANLADGSYTLFVQEINNNGDWSSSGSAAVTVITPTYNVGIGSLTGGTITANPATAKAGEPINLTIKPSTGKQLKAGTLKYNGVAITSGTSFVMPANNVTITAEFENTSVVVSPNSSSGSSRHSQNTTGPPTTVPNTTVPNPTGVPSFSDITAHWAKEDIEFVVSQGLMNGTNNQTFSPQVPMTRGMFVTALGRLAKIDTNSYNSVSFNDIKTNSIYGPYVEWANKNHIVSGTGKHQFMPDKAITREEMAAIMNNYAKNLGYSLPVTNNAVQYEDNQNISAWSKVAVGSMQQTGVLNGKPDNYFAPKDLATRAEACVVLHRFVKSVIE